jgi:hypothetical protein
LVAACNFLKLDEQAILEDTKTAFKKEFFRTEPFEKADAIERYAGFLLRHCDTLFAYQQLDSFKTIQLSEGSWGGCKKEPGNCFTFLTNNQEFMDFFVPSFLIDSIKLHTTEIGEDLIPSFTFCPRRDIPIKYRSKPDSIDGVRLNLRYQKEEKPFNPHYRLFHFIHINERQKGKREIDSVYDFLQKDTTFKDSLKYTIWVVPYSGF